MLRLARMSGIGDTQQKADQKLTRYPSRSYVICTTPRTGSTLLCKLLAATGVAGMPDSHFHVPSIERWLTVYQLDESAFDSRKDALQAIFELALARGMASADIFGLRMQRGSFGFFMEQLSFLSPNLASDVERIESVFGPTTFIHLSRPDRVGQAISRVRAEQTGLWHRHADGSEMERSAPPGQPQYDAKEIARHVEELTELDAAWERWFEEQKLEPLRLTYGALSANPQKELSRVLVSIGCDQSLAHQVETPTRQLADHESELWKQRFLGEHASD